MSPHPLQRYASLSPSACPVQHPLDNKGQPLRETLLSRRTLRFSGTCSRPILHSPFAPFTWLCVQTAFQNQTESRYMAHLEMHAPRTSVTIFFLLSLFTCIVLCVGGARPERPQATNVPYSCTSCFQFFF